MREFTDQDGQRIVIHDDGRVSVYGQPSMTGDDGSVAVGVDAPPEFTNAAGCEFWMCDAPCGAPVVETLVFLNPNINSHVHTDGSLRVCARHLAAVRIASLRLVVSRTAIERLPSGYWQATITLPWTIGNADDMNDSEAVHVMRHLMCSPAGREYVERKVLIPFGYSLHPGPVVRALDVLVEEAERIADNIEDQRREPDKTLCNVQSLRRVVTDARLAQTSPLPKDQGPGE